MVTKVTKVTSKIISRYAIAHEKNFFSGNLGTERETLGVWGDELAILASLRDGREPLRKRVYPG